MPAGPSPDPPTGQRWDASLLRDAQAHLERARAIDPSNVVAATFLNQVSAHTARRRPRPPRANARACACGIKLPGGGPPARDRDSPDSDSDDRMDVDGAAKDRKRART